jgi:hypothetical protein
MFDRYPHQFLIYAPIIAESLRFWLDKGSSPKRREDHRIRARAG